MNNSGKLFVVATPIGNLEDLSFRAVKVLKEVDLVAAEDTRHTRKLLQRYGISVPITSCHHHNEAVKLDDLLQRVKNGQSIALVSDAGTPAINDPGRLLISRAHEMQLDVVPVPGPSALTTALSVSGLNARSVLFEGFLPSRRQERRNSLKRLALEPRTVVIFEAPHRIVASIQDIAEAMGEDRRACIAREMTKFHESIRVGNLGELSAWIQHNSEICKGEFVIAIEAPQKNFQLTGENEAQIDHALEVLLEEFSPSKAAEIASRMLSVQRNRLYRRALDLSGRKQAKD